VGTNPFFAKLGTASAAQVMGVDVGYIVVAGCDNIETADAIGHVDMQKG
jgi:hypothetical protein